MESSSVELCLNYVNVRFGGGVLRKSTEKSGCRLLVCPDVCKSFSRLSFHKNASDKTFGPANAFAPLARVTYRNRHFFIFFFVLWIIVVCDNWNQVKLIREKMCVPVVVLVRKCCWHVTSTNHRYNEAKLWNQYIQTSLKLKKRLS